MFVPGHSLTACALLTASGLVLRYAPASLASFATTSGAVVLLMESVREVYKVQDSRDGRFLLAT